MTMNRRNVIVGLGTIVAGGGAALGSGAFSTADAERTLDVNVVTDAEIAEDFVDILLRPGDHESLGWDDGDEHDDGDSEFPEGDVYDSYTANGSEISLMQNDVTVVIGTEGNHLPPNSTVSYEPMFTVVNDEGDEEQDFDVEFEVTGTDATIEFEDESPHTAEVSNNSSEDIDVTVETGDQESESGTLEITITEADHN